MDNSRFAWLQNTRRKCVWCGKEFTPRSVKQNSCGDTHYRPCKDCGQLIEVKESYVNWVKAGGRRCSKCRGKAIGKAGKEQAKQRTEKFRQTCLERYGVDNPGKLESVKEKRRLTNQEKYGVDNVSQLPEIQNKIRQNSLEKYGVEHYSQDPEIRRHMIEGMVAKFGVDNALKSPELREKLRETSRKRYGTDYPNQSPEVREKIEQSTLEHFGVRFTMQSPEIRERVRETNMKKYGAPNIITSDTIISSVVLDKSKFHLFQKFREDPANYIIENYVYCPTLSQLAKDIGVSDTTISKYVRDFECTDLIEYRTSSMEMELFEFIGTICPEAKIVHMDKSVCKPQEIDIYLPEYQFGIECNPTCTHNSTVPDPWGGIKEPSYHKHKSMVALSKGVLIFHIFGYEWNVKQDIIKSMVASLLGKTEHKIYARNTKIVEVSSADSDAFLDNNHRQGKLSSSVRLGLEYQGKLVSLMTFSRMRTGIGKKSTDTENTWELARFCNILNTSVVGGASKLFKYFLKKYSPEKVVSFSDIAHTRGHLYEVLGFHQVSVSEPGYVWVNTIDDSYLSRVTCRKANLPKLFHEPDLDIGNMTEREIMASHGYAQVFDSGVIRWEYTV